ncbi:Protein LOL1 [Vitis vinifera]|uniref:Protein LOL1 n=1 Tax=Vitis vinifera TaxID=29760 RepID=A0A438E784_VITVI|nr:Protein LOL1 [Vitis vinifera]
MEGYYCKDSGVVLNSWRLLLQILNQLTICILFTMLFLYSLSHNLCNVATDFLVNHCDQLDSPKFINDPAGLEMAQLICGGCRTLLMYTRGATSVRCSCCHTVNLAPDNLQCSQQPTADMVALGASPFTVATCLALLFNG